MAEDDNFDIDIYGDGGGYSAIEQGDLKQEEPELILDASDHDQNAATRMDGYTDQRHITEASDQNGEYSMSGGTQSRPLGQFPNPQQGVKRKDHDDRPTDPDATAALLVSDLYWWTTDDDIRGWVNEAQCEDELKDVTFSEHKVNGKSKGQVFLEFASLQAATATKHHVESFSENGEAGRRHMVAYTAPYPNPFRTLPKDAPMRKDHQARGGFHSPNQGMNFGMNNIASGFRGGRGGFHNRGAIGGSMGGFGGNRPFPSPMGGGFQGPQMGGSGGFQGNPMGMQAMSGFAFNNRGNMMGGMRGGMRGRGGMQTPNMMGMSAMGPMGNMSGMGAMGMNPMSAGMNPMMGAMGGGMGMQGGFQSPNQGFSQGFFPGGDGSWNPHGAKRSRQE